MLNYWTFVYVVTAVFTIVCVSVFVAVADEKPMNIPIQAEPPPVPASKPHTKKKKKTAAPVEVVETPPEAGPSR